MLSPTRRLLAGALLASPLLFPPGIAAAQRNGQGNASFNHGVYNGGRGGQYDRGTHNHYDQHGNNGYNGYNQGYQGHGIGPGKGALIGGAGGAALGAIFGGGLKGSLIGGAAGAGIGAVAGHAHQQSMKRNYYSGGYR